jgi:chromosome segregation ATPase
MRTSVNVSQADLESLKIDCARLREDAAAAVLSRNAIKSEYETYKKRVHTVLAEQDSHYNRASDLEQSLRAAVTACDSKSMELQRALARLSEMEAIAVKVCVDCYVYRDRVIDSRKRPHSIVCASSCQMPPAPEMSLERENKRRRFELLQPNPTGSH